MRLQLLEIYAVAIGMAGMVTSAYAQSSAPATLSAAQEKSIAHAIGALKYPQERALADQWTPAKKVAEFICRSEVLGTLKQKDKSVDRVFLGDNTPGGLHLVDDRLLEGTGSVRSGSGWHDITFRCTLDPATGKAVRADTSAK